MTLQNTDKQLIRDYAQTFTDLAKYDGSPESMTPDKVEEIVKKIEYEIQINSGWKEDNVGFAGFTQDGRELVASILTQYHQDLMSEVVGKLEGMKRDQDAPKPDDPHFTGCGGCGEAYPAICGCREVNQALTEAQTIIKSK